VHSRPYVHGEPTAPPGGVRASSLMRLAVLVLSVTALGTAPPAHTALFGLSVNAPQDTEPLVVYVATSLTGPISTLVERWSMVSGVPVTMDLDATSRLANRIGRAAPGDVFLSADPAWTDWLAERGGIDAGSSRTFAGNRLVIAAPAGSSLTLESVAALSTAPINRLGLGGEAVPVGRYADQVLLRTGIREVVAERIVRGASARGVAEWVARGEVDAGLLYRTDALADDRIRIVMVVPEQLHDPVRYSASVLASSTRPSIAAELIDFIGSDGAASEFLARGFLSAEPLQNEAPGTAVRQGSRRSAGEERLQVPRPSLWSAVRLSLGVAALATLLGLVPAVAAGWVLARKRFPGRTLLSTVVMIPLVIPPVVTGFLLLTIFGAESRVGGLLSALGLHIPFTVLGAVVAAAVVGFPLYVVAIRTAFDAVDRRFEEVAATLGEPPRRSFVRVTLPLAAPGIAAGAILAFARGLGEFGATIVLAGNLEGRTRTIPLAVYSLIEAPSGQGAIWGLVGASIALCFGALVGYEVLMRRLRKSTETHHV